MKGIEIERRFLIRMPAPQLLSVCESSEIVQTYLLMPDGTRSRIRRRGRDGKYTYTHTVKKRISSLSRIETEREICEGEYDGLLHYADPARSTLYKNRYILPYREQAFEIDVYPFWTDRALMELELEDEEQKIELPDCIEIVKEVTADAHYTNSSLAREVPFEDLQQQYE